ncbi:hypothetical protein [Geothermobacter hydrogeniphilus]|uniref:Uncharacterized protein n=1 Tax=Geothermobacter hydrogeniphilus TaxID=1969733 RepID=A0A1X0XSM3_9BACT|nr:hypothetical protein [Geothermobacter hydrogeniphilus]ORJ55901.1 hypothetical protein B5V00_14680 [Geothermobacter hydrogeniphilus]
MDMERVLKNEFENWIVNYCSKYRIADKKLYSAVPKKTWHNSLNQFLKTEADVQCKFGGYLELTFMNKNPTEYTVHSELPIYDKSFGSHGMRVDLAITEVTDPCIWLNEDDIRNSLTAAIEVKYENYRYPYEEFDNGRIRRDIEKLATLTPENGYHQKIIKIMLIMVENPDFDSDRISVRETITLAREANVRIFSNITQLMC